MISILIPTYNYNTLPLVEELCRQAISESLEFEIIVADDASPINENTEINSKINQLSNCQFIRNEVNLGRGQNRNALVQKAKYDWALLMDCDTFPKDKNFIKKLKNVYKILKKIKKTLPKEKSLIGFAGSPWTLLTYMINKGSPKKNIKFLKNLKKKEVIKIIKRLEHLIYIHCKEQILAGADIIQLFDSWAGLIEKKNLKEFCINPNKNIVNKIKKNFPNNPVICFPKGINQNINNFIKEVNPHGISIDYDINLKNLNLNNDVVFQGGMNPKFLLGNNKRMFEEAKKYLDFFKNKPYIFNLGHGILPKTKPENVKRLVEFVRSYNL